MSFSIASRLRFASLSVMFRGIFVFVVDVPCPIICPVLGIGDDVEDACRDGGDDKTGVQIPDID